MQLHTLFNPRSVAIIGASNNPHDPGHTLMKNILAGGAREVYPISLTETEVLGHATHASVRTVAGSIDLAIIAVQADMVASILRECAEKHIGSVIVVSDGFSEASEAGALLEHELITIARENDLALLGPNTLGILNTFTDWNATSAPNVPLKGGIAFLSESGPLGSAFLDWAHHESVGISKYVSLGNGSSLSVTSFLQYLASDPDTSAIFLYLEQVSDGARLCELLSRITPEKPVVILKGSCAEPTTPHLGSLAPQDAVLRTALRQAGAQPVDTLRTFFSLAKLRALGVPSQCTNIALISNGGGPSVHTADLVNQSTSLALATLTEETQGALRGIHPSLDTYANPIDILSDADPVRFDETLRILADVPDIDAVVVLVTPNATTDAKAIAEVLFTYREKMPLVPVFVGGNAVLPGIEALGAYSIPSFRVPSDVVEALEIHAESLSENEDSDTSMTDSEKPRLSTNLEMYALEEMQSVLENYDLPLEGVFVTEKDAIGRAIKKLGDGPYAIKAISRAHVHKSDLGAVALNLINEEEIARAWEAIIIQVAEHGPVAPIDGMLIQNMVQGVECIVGMKRDQNFGPVLIFGLGEPYSKVFPEVTMRIAPVSKEEALAMIRSAQGYPLMTGTKTAESVKIEALATMIASLSHLALDYPEIEEVDFNPIIITTQGAHIVDARVMRKATETPEIAPESVA
jgi:acetate---CoA ligase (ADP-forming)